MVAPGIALYVPEVSWAEPVLSVLADFVAKFVVFMNQSPLTVAVAMDFPLPSTILTVAVPFRFLDVLLRTTLIDCTIIAGADGVSVGAGVHVAVGVNVGIA